MAPKVLLLSGAWHPLQHFSGSLGTDGISMHTHPNESKYVCFVFKGCLELLGLLDPKENVVILVILVCQVLEVWDLQVELDLLGLLDPRVLVSLVHKETGELLEKQAKEDYLVDLDPLDPQVIVNSVMVLLLKQTDRLTKKALEHLEKDSYKQSCWNLIPCHNHNQYYLFCAQYKHVNPSIYLNIHAYYNYTYDEVIKPAL